LSLAKRTYKQEKMLNQDLSRANQIQLSLLPKQIPTHADYDIRAHYVSCQEIGGDYYDFIEIDKDHLGIVVADVSGKGISGAMIMSMARAVMRLLAKNNTDARDTIVKANRILAADIKNVMFLTALYMVLNLKTHVLQVVNAGHNPLVIWNGKESKLIDPPGIAIGFDYGTIFEATLKKQDITLASGDRVVAYTDGVVECRSTLGNREYGNERLLKVIKDSGSKNSADFLNALIADLGAFQGHAPQADDVTIVTFKYTANKPAKTRDAVQSR
jgi:sigma-B regulation protein RsbU (phosphoserine phosphatase)